MSASQGWLVIGILWFLLSVALEEKRPFVSVFTTIAGCAAVIVGAVAT